MATSSQACVWCGARALRDSAGGITWVGTIAQIGSGSRDHEHETIDGET